ncbi:helix-turn-helix domain-containing protein [Methylomonas sp. EFPC3]|uniref:helix-turn-helix domain-containing protein n=1 Tax=Methylomonas sp. EFPC3 TaxID=3021710 RepID=UPI002415BB09|nr:helix-turn-helix domain-containing protein [Methylomonas sp. EFPC3]WFP51409.1 helix-turn-helix domain-containing protein [Methylomonas sp. EFPC3]
MITDGIVRNSRIGIGVEIGLSTPRDTKTVNAVRSLSTAVQSSIGSRLREERKRLGFSQAAFGGKVGVGKQAVVKWEDDRRSPCARYLALAGDLGMDIGYIVTGGRHGQ